MFGSSALSALRAVRNVAKSKIHTPGQCVSIETSPPQGLKVAIAASTAASLHPVVPAGASVTPARLAVVGFAVHT